MEPNKKIAIIIGVIILVVILGVILLLVFIKKKPTLPDGRSLAKPMSFYSDHKDDTLKYLKAVYPTATSFDNMSSEDLAKFYNSLWFYYNCEASFDAVLGSTSSTTDFTRHCWKALPGCGKTWPKLPYTPQGTLYSFQDWISSWTPWIESDSSKPASYFTSSVPGITLFAYYQGPGPLFAPQRAIIRNVFNTEQPSPVNKGKSDYIIEPALLPGKTGDWKSSWDYPHNWWLGTPDNSYIEVSYSDVLEIGSGAMVWWNGMPGTGVFLNVGKCKRGRNKADGVFQLATEMASTIEGRDTLEKWFKTTDPYEIVANLFQFPCVQSNVKVWNPITMKKIGVPFCTTGGPPISIPRTGKGWFDVPHFSPEDWYTWCGKLPKDPKKKNAYYIPNECIDKIINGETYSADRIAVRQYFDEAMTAMGLWLKYDTIQLTQSSQGNGFWQVEMLELRGFPPEARERDYSQFLQINGPIDPSKSPNISWREDNGFIEKYMSKIHSYLSMRDPLDIHNDAKAKVCISPVPYQNPSKLGFTWNVACKGNMSEMFSKLSLDGAQNKTPPLLNQCEGNDMPYA